MINLGNYESQRLEITMEIDSDSEDYLLDRIAELNSTITDSLNKFKEQHEFAKQVEQEKKQQDDQVPWD